MCTSTSAIAHRPVARAVPAANSMSTQFVLVFVLVLATAATPDGEPKCRAI